MKAFHHSHSFTKFFFKKHKLPPNSSQFWLFVLLVLLQLFFILLSFFLFHSFFSIHFLSFFLLRSTNFSFSKPLFPFPHMFYICTHFYQIYQSSLLMKCQLSQDSGSSWFFGLQGLSPMWVSKRNFTWFFIIRLKRGCKGDRNCQGWPERFNRI